MSLFHHDAVDMLLDSIYRQHIHIIEIHPVDGFSLGKNQRIIPDLVRIRPQCENPGITVDGIFRHFFISPCLPATQGKSVQPFFIFQKSNLYQIPRLYLSDGKGGTIAVSNPGRLAVVQGVVAL